MKPDAHTLLFKASGGSRITESISNRGFVVNDDIAPGWTPDTRVETRLQAYVDASLDKAGLRYDRQRRLFRAVNRKRQLTNRRLHEVDLFGMIKRRSPAGGVPDSTCCHTLRATGIAASLQNGGTVEKAQQIACHESPRTTKLYDQSNDTLTLDEIERVLL